MNENARPIIDIDPVDHNSERERQRMAANAQKQNSPQVGGPARTDGASADLRAEGGGAGMSQPVAGMANDAPGTVGGASAVATPGSAPNPAPAARTSGQQASDRYYTFTDPEHGDASWRPGSYAGVPRIPRPGAGSPRSASEGAAPAPAYVKAEVIGDKEAGASASKGRLGGVAQLVAGGAIAAVGVPMLILPGPGLLAIGGGLALAAHGAKRAFGRK